GCASFWRRVVLKEQCHRKTRERRLLHLHDRPIGARERAWQMPDLRNGSRPGHEEKLQRSEVANFVTGKWRRDERYARDARHGRNAWWTCRTWSPRNATRERAARSAHPRVRRPGRAATA